MTTFEVSLQSRAQASGTAPTLIEIDMVPFDQLELSTRLIGPGEARVVCQVTAMSSTVKAMLQDLVATPTELVVRRDGAMVFVGPLTSREVGGQSLTLTAADLTWYMAMWLITDDYGMFTKDVFTHVKDIVDTYQATTYGNFGIVTSAVGTLGTTRELTVNAADQKFVLDVITDVVQSRQKYLWVDPVNRQLRCGDRGTNKTATVFVDQLNLDDVSVQTLIGPGIVATDTQAMSQLEDGTQISAQSANTTMRSQYGRIWSAERFDDVSQAGTIQAHADSMLAARSSQLVEIDPNLVPVTGCTFADIVPGDTVTYSYDSGLGLYTSPRMLFSVGLAVSATTEDLLVEFV